MIDSLRISIDGPTGSGKSTLGMGLATQFDAVFLDTGLTFRALALLLAENELPDDGSWNKKTRHIPFSACGPERMLLHGHDVTDDLWLAAVDARLSQVADDPARRAQILSYHRDLLQGTPRIVVAGRDIATTLLTAATVHVYLTADLAARRGRKRLQSENQNPRHATSVGAITDRDLQTMEHCRRLQNGIILDTTHIPADSILNQVTGKINTILLPSPQE